MRIFTKQIKLQLPKIIYLGLLLFFTFSLQAQDNIDVTTAGEADVNGEYVFTGTSIFNGMSFNVYEYTSSGSGTTYRIDVGSIRTIATIEVQGWRLYDVSNPPSSPVCAGDGMFYFSDKPGVFPDNPADGSLTWSTGFVKGTVCMTQYTTPAPMFDLLPVELVRLDAESNDDDITLDWITATETDNEGFEIERSKNGKDWDYVDFVQGAGTTQEMQHYKFTDKNLESGIYYYRLRQLDWNGGVNYSHVVSARVGGAIADSMSVFPNPAKGHINISFPDLQEDAEILIMDGTGRLIKTGNWVGYDQQIEIDDLTNGFYYIQIRTASQSFTKRFIKI